MTVSDTHMASDAEEVTNRILTAPNVISFARLCLVPIYLCLLFTGHDIWAVTIFAVAAATDFVDGQMARRTHSVSKLGKILDPAVDTILMMTGVLGTCILGRCPIWIAVLIIGREMFFLIAGGILLKKCDIRVSVVYPGKFATTFLFIGFAALLLNYPYVRGLGLFDIPWLPGFGSVEACWGIWFVYAGLILQIGVTIYYCINAAQQLKAQGAARGL